MLAQDLATIDRLANAEGIKRSEMVRVLLLEGIAAHKPKKKKK